jgi:predicted DNA-binding WGR domain protein
VLILSYQLIINFKKLNTMARNFKDYFGNAAAANERVLKTTDAKQRAKSFENSSKEEQQELIRQYLEEDRILAAKREADKKALYNEDRISFYDPERFKQQQAIFKLKEKGIKPGKTNHIKVVEILEASYGLTDVQVINVTDKVIVGEKFNNETAGSDPCPRKKKEIIIIANVDGVRTEKTFKEKQKIVF